MTLRCLCVTLTVMSQRRQLEGVGDRHVTTRCHQSTSFSETLCRQRTMTDMVACFMPSPQPATEPADY